MARRPVRPLITLATGATAAALCAAPALATEGPPTHGGQPPTPWSPGALPGGLMPGGSFPTARPGARRAIVRARIVPRRVRAGHAARLRLRLGSSLRLRIVITRVATGHRVRVLRVAPRGRSVAVRLPARAHGRVLHRGRYRVRVAAIDASGRRVGAVRRTFVVRRGRR